MAAALSSRDQQRIAARGMASISPDAGLQVLGLLLRQSAAQVGVLPVDWPALLAQFPPDSVPPLFSVIASQQPQTGPGSLADGHSSIAESIAAARVEERGGMVLAHLRQQVADVLGISATELAGTQQPLNELGLDSLMAVELKNRIETRVGVALPISTFIEGPNIEARARLITERLSIAPQPDGAGQGRGDAQVDSGAPAAGLPADVMDVSRLSDDEVDNMLSTLLAERGSNS
jgi:aryl carrier-like protein